MLPNTLRVILLLFLLSQMKTTSFRNDELIEPDIQSDCQSGKFCSFESAVDISEVQDVQCCQGCSCGQECHLYGVCCPSVDESLQESDQFLNQSRALTSNLFIHADYKKKALYPCVLIHDLLNRARGMAHPLTQKETLRVITDCPSDVGNHEYTECKGPKTLEDFRLVSDEQGYVYRNEQCAKCHGVYKIIRWPLETKCNWLMYETFHSVDELKDFILYNCKLKSIPPKNLTYLNDFAVCFSPATPAIGWCDVSEDDQSSYTGKFAGRMSFSAILDNRDRRVPSKTHRCDSNKIWDAYTAKCRTVYCPTLTVPWQGQCVDMFDSYYGFKLQILFKILNWNDSHGFDAMESSIKEVKTQIGLDCFLCYIKYDLADNNKDVFLRVSLTTNENCTLDVLLNKLRRNKTLQINVEGFTLKVELHMRQVIVNKTLFYSHSNCNGGMFLTKELLHNCPRIKMPAVIVDAQVENILFEDTLDDHALQLICVEDYNDFMKSHKTLIGGQCMNRSDILLIVVLSLAHAYCKLS